MGRTPGKWIKTLLLGKKASKSSLSKAREISKSTKKEEVLISSKVHLSESSVDPSLTFQPNPVTSARNEVGVGLRQGGATDLTGNGVSPKEDGNSQQRLTNLGSEEDPDRIRHVRAATKAQAAYRGYLARRAFRTLKGIIRLQALIRGHLVRRQAVATLWCVWGIVKFQALARGLRTRSSDIGIEVQKVHGLRKFPVSKFSNSSGITTSAGKLRKNAFARKLLASSSHPMPLGLQYCPEDPNLAWEWLDRWTSSHFWEPISQPKKNLQSKSKEKEGSIQNVVPEKGKQKRGVRKLAKASTENVSSDSGNSKRYLKKVSSQAVVDPVQEHSQKETEKLKRNLRKLSNPRKEVPVQLAIDNEKPKHSMKKSSLSTAPDVPEQGNTDSAPKMKDVVVSMSEQSDLETVEKLPAVDNLVEETHDNPAVDLQPMDNSEKFENLQGMNKELNSKDDLISNGSQKSSQRRASLPAKIELQENGSQSTAKVPSYMAPTKSAKAKLRGQGSPRLADDEVETNGTARRYSLPSSTNSKLSSPSPRALRLVQSAAKGMIRSDRSLSSSRDGVVSDKAEWRR